MRVHFKERFAENFMRGVFNDIYIYFSDFIKAYVVGTYCHESTLPVI